MDSIEKKTDDPAVRALVFDLSMWKYAVAKAVGPKLRRVFYGPGTCFELRDVPEPKAPSDEWVTLKPLLTGFCGSDLSAIFFKYSPAMSAVSLGAGERAVFGHETLAEVVDVGAGAKGRVKAGDRVVIDPVLACEPRGLDPCPRCAVGEYATCERAGTARPKGVMLGACTEYPGGFSERMVAHKSQVFRVPDSVPNEVAVLTEPLAIAVHAVLRHPPKDGEDVLVVGGGMIAFAILWAIKEIFPGARVTLFTVESYQLPIAQALGADRIWSPENGPLMDQAARATSAQILRPVIGRPFLSGGFDRVYDCVGTKPSFDDALRVTRGGGTIVLVGNSGQMALDTTFVWNKELKIEGTVFYGNEEFRGRRARTFDATLELITSTRAPLARLVTHTFPLEQYAEAIEVNLDRGKHKSVKAAFRI
jgi:threonine dehydrogenase-like Zn-dependent dehydrogenase